MRYSAMRPTALLRCVLHALAARAATAGVLPFRAHQLGEHVDIRADAVGFTGGWGSVPEQKRLAMRKEAGYKWEFPHEPPAYRARQEQRWVEIQSLDHYQERLDNFVQYTQVRTVPNYTQNGFDVIDVPHDLWQRMRDRLHDQLPKARRESDVQGIYGKERPRMVGHGEGRSLLAELQPLMEAWVPEIKSGLQPVTAYGMRAYGRGASLGFHADRVDTHIISAIVHVDHSYDDDAEPWPIEIEGHDGLRHAVDLKPGQMLLYESAKCPHGRSASLKGDWYASVFVHFKPKDMETYWPYQQKDVWLAVPPGWDSKPLLDDGTPGERWAGAFLTHDSVVVQGMADRLALSKKGLPDKVKRHLAAAHPAPAPAAGARQRHAAARIDPELLKKAHAAALAAADPPVRAGPSLARVAPKEIPKEHSGEGDDDGNDDDAPPKDERAREMEARAGARQAARAARAAATDDDDDGDDAAEARAALARPRKAPKKRRSGLPARRDGVAARRHKRRADDDDVAPPPKAAAADDDEIETVVGLGVLAGLGWWFGGISLLSCTLCLRRAIVTRGRSLGRRRKEKADLPL